MTLIKEHLVRSTYDNVGLSKSKSSEAVETLFEIMRNALARERMSSSPDLGNFA
jgi:nucleoid DNA-binding protein